MSSECLSKMASVKVFLYIQFPPPTPPQKNKNIYILFVFFCSESYLNVANMTYFAVNFALFFRKIGTIVAINNKNLLFMHPSLNISLQNI